MNTLNVLFKSKNDKRKPLWSLDQFQSCVRRTEGRLPLSPSRGMCLGPLGLSDPAAAALPRYQLNVGALLRRKIRGCIPAFLFK